jgi:hypothetical protein
MWIIKKFICVSCLFLFPFAAIYAVSAENITLLIQGSGSENFTDSFKQALTIEARAIGYHITENPRLANYSIKFTVEDDETEEKSIFTVTLFDIIEASDIITMDYFFADEEEMMLYGQLVFFLLIANIPEIETPEVEAEPEENHSWRDKRVYFNPSFVYSVKFLNLIGDNLYGGTGASDGIDDPDRVAPLDNKSITMMGAGMGLEFQFLSFMSIEPYVQISFEEVANNNLIYNLMFSLRLKLPLKVLKHFIIEPYGAAAYSKAFPAELDIYEYQPISDALPKNLAFGGGIQAAVKAGNSSAIFFDANFMYFGETSVKNQFGELYPYPEVIKYKNYVLGFGVGFKFGFSDKKN